LDNAPYEGSPERPRNIIIKVTQPFLSFGLFDGDSTHCVQSNDKHPMTDCHFLHISDRMSAALSNCDGQYSGHIIQDDLLFEINPLSNKAKTSLTSFHSMNQTVSEGIA
jgi:hypothetical protein